MSNSSVPDEVELTDEWLKDMLEASTPGPWHVQWGGNFKNVWAGDENGNHDRPSSLYIADINERDDNGYETRDVEVTANACLIAALPQIVKQLRAQIAINRELEEKLGRGCRHANRLQPYAQGSS